MVTLEKGTKANNSLLFRDPVSTDVTAGDSYSIAITDEISYSEDEVLVWIDYNFESIRNKKFNKNDFDFCIFDVMMPIKLFLAATRNGDWITYHTSKVQLLPLLFATNRSNYSRYMPAVLCNENRLPDEVKQAFQEKLFVAQLSSGPFKGVWYDYALETTKNKALKGQGGIIGLTNRGPALERWFLTRPITASYAE